MTLPRARCVVVGMRISLASVAIALAIAPACSTGLSSSSSPGGGSVGGASFAPLGAALVRAIADGQKPRAEARPAPPIALTASDGSGLELVKLDVAAVVVGPIALTELRLRFHNPEARRREGRFSITLPPDAAVSRFAMKNETWLEAEVVPRQEARRVYESYLKQRVDPALLEKDAGNTFSARVFPIEASADKELILGYSHAVGGADGARVALAGLPAVKELAWTVTIDGETRSGAARDRAPTDLWLGDGGDRDRAVIAGDVFVARVTPPLGAAIEPLGPTTILVDTSASRASLLRRQTDVIAQVTAAIARRDASAEVTVVAFDQDTQVIARGPAARIGRDVAPGLIARGGLGASNLAVGLRAARGAARVVLVSDGIATIGERDTAKLAELVRGGDIGRLDAIVIGALQDRDRLAALVAAGDRPGAIVDGEAAGALAALERGRLRALGVRVAGASAVWPDTIHGAGAGEPVLVAGRRTGDGALSIELHDGGKARTIVVPVVAGPRALVERAAARAELVGLDRVLATASDAPAREAARAAIERHGVTHRLVTSQTSLLVLETDADYARFCLPRNGLTNVLTVDGGAVRVLDRGGGALPLKTPRAGCPQTPPAQALAADDAPPAIDPALTRTGITIDDTATRNVPVPGRTFESTLGAAAGSQGDGTGTAFSGASSVENTYVVDGVAEKVQETIVIEGRAPAIDPTSTTQGITIDQSYTRNIPVRGRTFDSAGGPMIDLRSTTQGLVRPSDDLSALDEPDEPKAPPVPLPYEGRLLTVMTHLRDGAPRAALTEAVAWYVAEPTELAAIVALGEALEGNRAFALAARAYGSILDRFPGRVELVRFAGERLERVGLAAGPMVLDAYRQAVADRPDHANGYRLLAIAQLRARDHAGAAATLRDALTHADRDSIRRILQDDLAVVAAAWAAADPSRRAEIDALLDAAGTTIATRPSVRFVLHWETDTNDVDLHVRDRHGNHAYYAQRELPSGGLLLDDVTTGYGPEAFVLDGTAPAAPYALSVYYYARGPMGLGLGTVQVLTHDGRGGVTIEGRPFVMQQEHAMIELGDVTPALK